MVAIFVILTILVCLLADVIIQRRRSSQTEPWAFPERAYLHAGHSWAELDRAPARAARVGVDAFLSQLLGKIDRIEAQPVGAQLIQGEPMLALEQNGRRLFVPAPISGEVKARNDQMLSNPEILRKMAYGAGWIYVLMPTLSLSEERRLMQTGRNASKWLQSEYRRLAAYLTTGYAARVEMALQDGGLPAPGALSHLNDKEWAAFQTHFLNQTTPEKR